MVIEDAFFVVVAGEEGTEGERTLEILLLILDHLVILDEDFVGSVHDRRDHHGLPQSEVALEVGH